MKIAIVTQPLGPNLGGIIQNWALQQALKKSGHSPVTISYSDFKPVTLPRRLRITARNLRTILRRVTGSYNRFYKVSDTVPNQANIDFINSHIDTTEPSDIYTPVKDAEAYIVGSDQVWRPRYNQGVLYDSFLKFVENQPVRRIAYAASFGTDRWEYDPEQTTECSRLLKMFDAVSVRESGGIALCRDHLGCDAIQAIDPTMLLNATDYRSICAKPPVSGDYVATYFLDYDTDRRRTMRQMRGLGNIADINPHRASVPQWLGTIAGAKTVLTDSFHGAVFSILFRRPFIVFANPDRGNSRMESLLLNLGLSNRLISNPAQTRKAMESPIDWQTVEARIDELRRAGFNFLDQALK